MTHQQESILAAVAGSTVLAFASGLDTPRSIFLAFGIFFVIAAICLAIEGKK